MNFVYFTITAIGEWVNEKSHHKKYLSFYGKFKCGNFEVTSYRKK